MKQEQINKMELLLNEGESFILKGKVLDNPYTVGIGVFISHNKPYIIGNLTMDGHIRPYQFMIKCSYDYNLTIRERYNFYINEINSRIREIIENNFYIDWSY